MNDENFDYVFSDYLSSTSNEIENMIIIKIGKSLSKSLDTML